MDINGNQRQEAERARQRIRELLQEMPLENLAFVEQFVLFLDQRGQAVAAILEQKDQVPYLHPTITIPASDFSKLIGIMPPVGGNALIDTEALYDDV